MTSGELRHRHAALLAVAASVAASANFRAMESSSDSGERSAPKQIVEADRIEGRKISHIQFGTFSSTEVARLSEFEVTSDKGYEQPSRTPVVSPVSVPRSRQTASISSKMTTFNGGGGVKVESTWRVSLEKAPPSNFRR